MLQGEDDTFVAMPATKDKKGMFHEVAFPNKKELRDEICAAVIDEFENQSMLPPEDRGYSETD
jgi:DNA-binding cell septation regulator SpoVG